MSKIETFLEGCHEQISGKLWQCSWLGEWKAIIKDKVDGVINCVDTLPDSVVAVEKPLYISWPFEDVAVLPDVDIANSVAQTGTLWIARGHTLSVHCVGGMNRSGLICALIMQKLGLGSGKEIVRMIQKENPDALYNDTFRKYIETLPDIGHIK